MHRRAKLVVAGLLVLAGGALAYAGAAPEGYATVGAVLAEPAAHAGRDIELKASVVQGSLRRDASPITFVVTDGAVQMPVRWDPAIPIPEHEAGGTIEGKNVVVHGRVVLTPDEVYFLAHDMQVGCASKYEAR